MRTIYNMLKLGFLLLLTQSSGLAEDIAQADAIALKYCKMEYTQMDSYEPKDSRVVNQKLFLERMLQLKDGALNAHYAKDLIVNEISTYENFLATRKSWKNTDLTEKDAARFEGTIKSLKRDLAVIEKHYPTDYGVFDRLDKYR